MLCAITAQSHSDGREPLDTASSSHNRLQYASFMMESCLCTKRWKRIRTRQKVTQVRRHLLSEDFTELCLDEEGLTDVDVARLSKSLRTNRHLVGLHLCENYISRLGALDLASAVAVHPTLREVWLSINCVGDDGANSFARVMRHHPTLTSLNLGENGIGTDGAVYLSAALRENTTLDTLWLNGNKIGDEGIDAIARALELNSASALTTLSLNEANITDDGAQYLARYLSSAGCKLQVLGLYGNFISDKGAILLANALADHNTSLTELYLGKNRIGSAGAKAFAKALRTNACMTKLWLSNNKIGDSGASALGEALVSNKTLVELNIARNAITPRGTRPLGRALMQNRTLVSLGMSGNTILDEGVKTLAPGVGLSSIEELRIGEAGVTAEGAVAIVEELNDHSRRLSVLDVTGNEIDDIEVLEEVMTHNTSASGTTIGRLKSSQHSQSGLDPESVTDNSDAERCEEQIAMLSRRRSRSTNGTDEDDKLSAVAVAVGSEEEQKIPAEAAKEGRLKTDG